MERAGEQVAGCWLDGRVASNNSQTLQLLLLSRHCSLPSLTLLTAVSTDWGGNAELNLRGEAGGEG